MSPLFFALLGAFLLGLGARDQLIVAQLRDRLGASGAMLTVGVLGAVLTACLAAWAGAQLGEMLSASARTMFVAFALGLAAFELAWPNRLAPLREPTRSLGAIALVLLSRQATDAARLLVCALAAALATPGWAALGGAIGGAGAVALGWSLGGKLETHLPLRAIRVGLAVLLAIGAVAMALSARGLID